jgi:hypothetical protein
VLVSFPHARIVATISLLLAVGFLLVLKVQSLTLVRWRDRRFVDTDFTISERIFCKLQAAYSQEMERPSAQGI